MTAESLIKLKIKRFDWVKASRGLVSDAPKKTMPTIVVIQSAVPIRMSVVQNRTALLTMFNRRFLCSLNLIGETVSYAFSMLICTN